MRFSLSNRALLRGLLAGAVVLTGTGCSRSDRAESGSDTTAAMLPDTSNNAAQPYGADTAAGAVSDTARQSSSTQPSSSGDDDAAGYRPMERDTTAPSTSSDTSVSAIPDTISTEMAGASDTAAADHVAMARDTSTVADQAGVVVAENADTAADASRIHQPEDSTPVLAQERVRPPEDSTEILGTVTTTNEAVDETADEQVIVPEDEVGAAAVGGVVTGGDAVSLMTRQGVRCTLVDADANEAVRWDMSSTPVTLNPCGMGSMVLSRIWTERGQ